MGYRREAIQYKLVFDDPSMEGLEVTTKSVSSGRLLKLMKLADLAGSAGKKRQFTADDARAVESLFNGFASALVSWNLEDEKGEPVPPTLEGVQEQDFDFVLSIIMSWIEAVAGVSSDLGKDSSSGVSFPEGSLPMDPL